MTNRQWLMEQMQNMSDEELLKKISLYDYVCKTSVCKDINCASTKCREFQIDWLKSEHKEPIKLSDAERVILENGDKEQHWIARDKNGGLYTYTEKPSKNTTIWESSSKSFELTYFKDLFQFIKWSDNEPYNIEELLKGK